jgi:hypothetical protein
MDNSRRSAREIVIYPLPSWVCCERQDSVVTADLCRIFDEDEGERNNKRGGRE